MAKGNRQTTQLHHHGFSGANQDDMQQMNRVLVLSLLRKSSITTRAELAKSTGLKRATITNIISDFIQSGIVKETGFIEGEKGRRSIGISLNGEQNKIIAIRLARIYFSIALFDITGEKYTRKQVPINFIEGADHALRLMKHEIKDLLDSNDHIMAIGIALPGPYLKNENKIGQISDFPGWEGVDIIDELQNQFQIPTYAEHDGNAATLAHWWLGDYGATEHSVLMSVLAGQGTGIGLIENGRLFQGGHGCSGELGHTTIAYDGPQCACGNRGCLDLYCSSIILMRNIKEALAEYPTSILHNVPLTHEMVSIALSQGDELALVEFKKMARLLAFGLVNAINMYDPDIIVLDDELAIMGKDVLLETVTASIKQRILPNVYENLQIFLGTLDDSILLGAMSVATDKLFNNLDFLPS